MHVLGVKGSVDGDGVFHTIWVFYSVKFFYHQVNELYYGVEIWNDPPLLMFEDIDGE